MRFIPTKIHGLADYAVGLVLIGLPFLAGWNDAALRGSVALGAFAILYSAFTSYEFGAVRILSIRTHLTLDFVFALAALGLAWLFAVPSTATVVLTTFAVVALILVATTKLHAER